MRRKDRALSPQSKDQQFRSATHRAYKHEIKRELPQPEALGEDEGESLQEKTNDAESSADTLEHESVESSDTYE